MLTHRWAFRRKVCERDYRPTVPGLPQRRRRNMKRTRRVEVVRYTSRITEIHSESAAVVMAGEQQAGDLILDLLERIAPAEPVNYDEPAPDQTVADQPPRRWSFFRLGNVLRR